ncbi:MAG: hypothetical protein KAI47_21250 [Deltaproteobacteria bacterium]|nr:hypothetical protein [Deltaproteobacteria bacterium]
MTCFQHITRTFRRSVRGLLLVVGLGIAVVGIASGEAGCFYRLDGSLVATKGDAVGDGLKGDGLKDDGLKGDGLKDDGGQESGSLPADGGVSRDAAGG